MAAVDIWYAIGGLAGAAVILALLAIFGSESVGKKIGVPASLRKPFKWVGIFGLIIVLLAYFGLFSSIAPAQTVEEQPVWELSLSESLSYVTYDSTEHKLTMACDFNDTSDAFANATQYLEVNVTVSRADVLLAAAIAQCSFGPVGIVDIAGANDEYIVDQNADDTWSALFSKENSAGTAMITAWEHCSLSVAAGGSNYVILNVTLNADAMAEMAQYDSVTFTFTIAGVTFEVDALKAV